MTTQVSALFETCDDCADGPGWIIIENEWNARIAICNECWKDRGKPEVLGYVE